MKYILDAEGNPVAIADPIVWAKWYENIENRIVDHTTFGNIEVSTVFLGLDHSHGIGPVVLWETMIFGGPHDSYCERYSTIEEARRGHAEAVELVRPVRITPEDRLFEQRIG